MTLIYVRIHEDLKKNLILDPFDYLFFKCSKPLTSSDQIGRSVVEMPIDI